MTVPTPQAQLPLPWVSFANPGSQWAYSFEFQNDDGTLMNIVGKTFELIIRSDVRNTTTSLVSVSSSAATSQGSITVNTTTSTILVVLTATGTAALSADTVYPLTLWMDPGLSDATAMVNGFLSVRSVVAA